MKASNLKAGNYFFLEKDLCICIVDEGEKKEYLIVGKKSFGTLNGNENVTYIDDKCVSTSVKVGNSEIFY